MGLVFRSHKERRLRIIDILFLMATVYSLANQRIFNVDQTIRYLSMAGVWFFVKESDSPRFERGLLKVVVLAAVVHAIVAVLQSFGILSNYNYFFKTTGLFVNPGPFGCYLSFALADFPALFQYGSLANHIKLLSILTFYCCCMVLCCQTHVCISCSHINGYGMSCEFRSRIKINIITWLLLLFPDCCAVHAQAVIGQCAFGYMKITVRLWAKPVGYGRWFPEDICQAGRLSFMPMMI